MRRGAVGGGALVLSGSVVAALAGRAAAATIPDADLAYLRLLIGAELLAADFQTQALASGKLSRQSATAIRKMAADEKAHYAGLAQLVTAAGQTPATADDIDFAYREGHLRLGSVDPEAGRRRSRRSSSATYLGAIENVQTPELRLPLGQIAANEAQHVGAVAALAGRHAIGRAFAAALSIDAVSAALDAFES